MPLTCQKYTMINDVFVATGVDQNVAILRVACQSRFIYQCGEEMRLMNKFSHITMVLLSLAGIPGDIIVDRGHCFELEENLPFLVHSDEAMISKIISVGYNYRLLRKFAEQNYWGGTAETKQSSATTLYTRALCGGLNEVLDDYHDIIVQEEQTFLKNADTPVSHIYHKIRGYEFLFKKLAATMERVEEDTLKGAQICDLLHQQSLSGNPLVSSCFSRLLFHCNQVLYNQTLSWLLHGSLVDPHKEYFVQQRPMELLQSGMHETTDPSQPTSLVSRAVQAEYEWNTSYVMNMAMLPKSYFPPEAAVKILFIGKALQILRRRYRKTAALQHPDAKAPADATRTFNQHLLLFGRIFATLKQRPRFDAYVLGKAIEQIRRIVAKHLWRVVVHEGALLQRLQSLKDLFLMGKGHFFQSFIDETREMMRKPPKATTERDVNAAFARAAISSMGDDEAENVAAQYRFRVDLGEFSYNNFSSTEGLVVLGAAAPRDSAIRLSCIRNTRLPMHETPVLNIGAVWFHFKRAISNGFKTSFTFSTPKRDDGATGFALVMQNSGKLALPVHGRDPFKSIAGAVSVVLRANARSHKQLADVSIETPSSTDTVTLPVPLAHDTRHEMRVTYGLDDSGVGNWVLQVYLNGVRKPVIAKVLKLSDVLATATGGPRCWVGFVGCSSRRNPVGTDANSVYLHQWGFRALVDSASAGYFAWRQLSLEFDVPPPLHLVITQQALEAYNALFQFFLVIRRVGSSLERVWGTLSHSRLRRSAASEVPNLMRMMLLRQRMAFLVDNLQYYLQVDVVDAQFSQLMDQLRDSKSTTDNDFTLVVRAHEKFLSALVRESFMQVKVIRHGMDKLFWCCLQFCNLLDRFPLEEVPERELNDIERKFVAASSFLLSLLMRTGKHKALVLRLDYNNFFSTSLMTGKR